jgi:hypothetical protein
MPLFDYLYLTANLQCINLISELDVEVQGIQKVKKSINWVEDITEALKNGINFTIKLPLKRKLLSCSLDFSRIINRRYGGRHFPGDNFIRPLIISNPITRSPRFQKIKR